MLELAAAVPEAEAATRKAIELDPMTCECIGVKTRRAKIAVLSAKTFCSFLRGECIAAVDKVFANMADQTDNFNVFAE